MGCPWGPFAWDLDVSDRGSSLTDSARAVRIFLRQEPPHRGAGMVRFDDLAMAAWEEAVPTDGTPHARDFLRIEAAPGPVTVGLTFEAHIPAAVAPWT